MPAKQPNSSVISFLVCHFHILTIHKGEKYTVAIQRIGKAYVPIHLNIIYKDGTRELVSRSIACWPTGDESININFIARKPIQQLILGSDFDADQNKENNVWNP